MLQRIMFMSLAFLLSCLTVYVVAPVVIKRELHRQHVACQTMQKHGYQVECQ